VVNGSHLSASVDFAFEIVKLLVNLCAAVHLRIPPIGMIRSVRHDTRDKALLW
jgi:hypothetical protein